MTTYKADLGALDPIEKASRDEIEALQLERLKWTLRDYKILCVNVDI